MDEPFNTPVHNDFRFQSGSRSALLVGSSEFTDEGLQQLITPAQDLEALAEVLSDPAIGCFEVETCLNEPSYEVNQTTEAFFANRARDDLLLFYFSGHGIKDETGRLYLTTPDTQRDRLRTTSIPASLLNDLMRYSHSKQQLLILDCCFSAAFARGMVAKAGEAVGSVVGAQEQLGGRGRMVLTASDAMQYAFEGNRVEGEAAKSIFTKYLVQALASGEADLDQDGEITFEELYTYVYDQVVGEMPLQRPEKWDFGVRGSFVVAQNPNPVIKKSQLPEELQASMSDMRPWVREGAVRQLERLLEGEDEALALAAYEALQELARDDSEVVRQLANQSLDLDPPSNTLDGKKFPPKQEVKPLVSVKASETEPDQRISWVKPVFAQPFSFIVAIVSSIILIGAGIGIVFTIGGEYFNEITTYGVSFLFAEAAWYFYLGLGLFIIGIVALIRLLKRRSSGT